MRDVVGNGEHLVISADKVPVAAYQAIYHKLTSKVEKISQVFPDAYLIRKEDMIQLNRMLEQAIVQYPVKGCNSTCTVYLKDDERIDPSSFEKFKIFNFGMNKPTAKLSYRFDFFTVLPVEIPTAADIVQRFAVSIVIDQDFIEDNDGSIASFLMGTMSGNNINLVVEYSDFNVGRNLQVTVQDWVGSLQAKKVQPWIKLLESKSDFVTTIAPRFAFATAMFGLSRWYSPIGTIPLFHDLFVGVGWACLSFILGNILSVEMYRQISQAKPLTFICLTKGDLDRSTTMTKRRSTKGRIALCLLSALIIAIPANLFSSYAYDLIRITAK